MVEKLGMRVNIHPCLIHNSRDSVATLATAINKSSRKIDELVDTVNKQDEIIRVLRKRISNLEDTLEGSKPDDEAELV